MCASKDFGYMDMILFIIFMVSCLKVPWGNPPTISRECFSLRESFAISDGFFSSPFLEKPMMFVGFILSVRIYAYINLVRYMIQIILQIKLLPILKLGCWIQT